MLDRDLILEILEEYQKQEWIDHIVDEETGIVRQRGTPHSQDRMNHMEEGIYQANIKGNLSLQELESINSLIMTIESRLGQVQDDTSTLGDEIDSILTELADTPDNNTVDDLISRLKRLEDATMSNITGNPFEISLKDLDGVIVTGIWNKQKQRLEV